MAFQGNGKNRVSPLFYLLICLFAIEVKCQQCQNTCDSLRRLQNTDSLIGVIAPDTGPEAILTKAAFCLIMDSLNLNGDMVISFIVDKGGNVLCPSLVRGDFKKFEEIVPKLPQYEIGKPARMGGTNLNSSLLISKNDCKTKKTVTHSTKRSGMVRNKK